MKFTSTHFELIAAKLKGARPPAHESRHALTHWEDCVDAIAFLFEQDNPNFDLSRFLTACEDSRTGDST